MVAGLSKTVQPMRSPDPAQLPLFGELIENLWTRDEPFETPDGSFGARIVRPTGYGWRIVDFRRDKRTRWQRRQPIVLGPRWATSGDGEWRR